jgi:hypothetical protein
MNIEIANPRLKPATKFIVANSTRVHICTPPDTFPEYCTIILKEGEPVDYVSVRGLCSVLGIVRKPQPSIVSNKCVVKNIRNMSYFSIELIDEALNTFKIKPDGNPMWIKIDLRCTTHF